MKPNEQPDSINLFQLTSSVSQYALNAKFTEQFDQLQSVGKCCGITNHFDYIQTPWSELAENEMIMVPDSCCHIDNSYARQRSLDKCRNGESHIYSDGCHTKVEQTIDHAKADIKVSSIFLCKNPDGRSRTKKTSSTQVIGFTNWISYSEYLGSTLSQHFVQLMMQLLIGLIILHVACIILAYWNWRSKRDCRNVPKTVIVRL